MRCDTERCPNCRGGGRRLKICAVGPMRWQDDLVPARRFTYPCTRCGGMGVIPHRGDLIVHTSIGQSEEEPPE